MASPSNQQVAFTYGLLCAIADQLAHAVHQLDQQPGNRVLILAHVMDTQEMLAEAKLEVGKQLAMMETDKDNAND